MPYTPEKNGITECWNKTVVKLAHLMIFMCNVSDELWPKAMSHATYIQNVPICVPCQTRHHMRNDLASILTSHSSKNLVILFGFSIRNRIHQNWMSARSYIPLFGMRRPKGHKICIMMLLKSQL